MNTVIKSLSMIKLNQKELNEYANTILNDYDSNNPSSIYLSLLDIILK